MRRWAYRLALVVVLFLQGCLLDIAPAREPIEDAWKAHMLAGEYGEWVDGKKTSFVGDKDEINSSPVSAGLTRYGVDVREQSALWGGAWSMLGGMVGRVVLAHASVELFGNEIARVHGPWYTVSDKDYSYEFFLVVRPIATGRGRLIKQWSFPREALILRRRDLPSFSVEAFVAFDETHKIATITITGLVRPFSERVDLSRELPAPN